MKKKLSLVVMVVLVVLSVFAIAGCGTKDKEEETVESKDTSLTDIQEKGTLILGCDDEFPPMGFVDESGELVGFDIDLARAVAEQMGVTLEVKPIDWDNKEMELINGNIDVIWNGYSITADRNTKVEFTKPYLNNSQLIVVRADSDIKTLKDLEGKIVGAQVESAAEDLLEADEALLSSLKEMRSYDDYQKALLDLKSSDRIDAVAVDKILIEYIMSKEEGTYKVLDESLGDEYFGIGCRKDSVALRTAIDKALDELQEDGKIDTICEKWFDSNIVIRNVNKLTQADLDA
ncbi:MAG: amino acid ABC transporter substrate-binding protein [Clostridiales Family XIII bacterium]|jgi:polar amino acid transport system substrate-binding protein|nr:amino acid ABC transporter substrate-binding protein [Clostridiales Family XIII bacterium]